MVYTAVIGTGYWGTNIVRVLNEISSLKYVCDKNTTLLEKNYGDSEKYVHINITDDYQDILDDKAIEVVFIATPPETHFNIAKDCLMAKKHTFIEKPMTSSSKEASKLITLAEKNNRKLAVGHTFLYSSPVIKVKSIIDSGELGKILHVQMSRQNLGKFQLRCDVIYDLSPHDLSMLLYWFPGFEIKNTSVSLFNHHPKLQPDTAYIDIVSDTGLTVNLAYSWIYPYKIRNTVIIGEKKSIIYDDTNSNASVMVYNKGIDRPNTESFGDYICSYRTGDCYIPYISMQEPLKLELQAFLDHTEFDEDIPNTGENGRDVVRLIEKISSVEYLSISEE